MTADNSELLKMKRYTKEQRVFIIEQYFKNNESFSNKIIFSDEAHFHLDELINRQNCRTWDSENPKMIVEKQMDSQLFDTDFSLEASSDHSSSKMQLVRQ